MTKLPYSNDIKINILALTDETFLLRSFIENIFRVRGADKFSSSLLFMVPWFYLDLFLTFCLKNVEYHLNLLISFYLENIAVLTVYSTIGLLFDRFVNIVFGILDFMIGVENIILAYFHKNEIPFFYFEIFGE
jgi:hypothetical protein